MTGLARLLIRIFFRRIEVEHVENLSASGPVLLVANHTNGLVDGLLLMAALARYPRFLGKSTLFKIAPLWPFLKLAGVVPVFRAVDGVPGDGNVSAFATCREILAQGGMVAVFPEGISHDGSSLQPLRTGAARIALEAGIDDAVEGLVTIAVGLTYDAKARFRSRALVRIGSPVATSGWADAYRSDPHEAVREFTLDVAHRLSAVSPSYSSWEQAAQVTRVAEVVVRPPDGAPASDTALAARVDVSERLARIAQQDPGNARLGDLFAAFGTYERDLDFLGLNDSQLALQYPRAGLRGALAWSALKILFAFPFAIIGVAIHVVPFEVVKWIAKTPSNESIKSTVKLLGCFASFIVVYAVVGFFVGRSAGAVAGLLVAIGAPLCGYVTVRLAERLQRIGGLLEAYRTLRQRQDHVGAVLAHRSAVLDAARAVLTPS
jgi:1-acyl-sn-glycerol-3-phosphate acyltransferase